MKQIAIAIRSLNGKGPFSFRKTVSPAVHKPVFLLLILIFLLAEFLHVYFVMPLPGSQVNNTLELAYRINSNIIWIRFLTIIGAVIAIRNVFRSGRRWEKIGLSLLLAGCMAVFLFVNYRLAADAIFRQPVNKSFMAGNDMEDKSKLVIGVSINGESKAYPIQVIGYHHQVLDTIGHEAVMVTYCTVCRTGRVFSTLVNGRPETFRLVGMDQYNAVFEDATTKSWWQQATGEAIAGPLKGTVLKEIPAVQLTAAAWLRKYPGSKIMAQDPLFDERYFRLEDYDRGTMQSPLVKRDYRSWQRKSWIVGIKNQSASVAYDWNELVNKRLIQDSMQTLPVLLAMENDTTTFHVYDRRLNGQVLQFDTTVKDNGFTDRDTNSTWNMDGICISGPLKGKQLNTVQAYNEFWHAWQSFQPNAKRYTAN